MTEPDDYETGAGDGEYDPDAGLTVIRKLCTLILDTPGQADAPLVTVAELNRAGRRLARHARWLDEALMGGTRPPRPWLAAASLPPPGKYQHAEAYALMLYRAEDGSGEEETVWNSRDGVTPFAITLRSGKTATHADWRNDRPHPGYHPRPGERVFTDITPEIAWELADRRYRAFEADQDPLWLADLGTPDEARRALAAQFAAPGAPVLMYVHDDGSCHLDPQDKEAQS